MIRALYAVALFVSAMLLFVVQPMVAKMILPLLGGTPAVWNTCLVFFQATLLLGYLYSHAAARWMRPRTQSAAHLLMLAVPFLMLPLMTLPLRLEHAWPHQESAPPILAILDHLGISTWLEQPRDPARPVLWLLLLLAVSVGIPFFVVSATAPLLQHWYARSGQPKADDPYFLYAASNAGSIVGLLGYPILVEPYQHLVNQAWLWGIGYGLLAGLIVLSALALWQSSGGYGSSIPAPEEVFSPAEAEFRPTLGCRLTWVMLAAIPSSLLLGVTTFLSTNVAAVPLLWIIPLTLYLFSFVLVFSRWAPVAADSVGRILPIVILIQTFAFAIDLKRGEWVLFLLHLGCFFLTALYCHGRLAQDRPHPRYLTEFYLWLSAGGVLGGLFNALLAPMLFNSLAEYPLALVLACLFLPKSFGRLGSVAHPEHNSTTLPARQLPSRPVFRGRGFESTILRTSGSPGRGESAPFITWADLWLPLALGLLMIVLILGLQAVGLEALWLKATLLLGLPAAICYAFIGRPIRFALGIGALMLVGGIGKDVFHSSVVHQERSFFGVLTVVDERSELDPSTTFRKFVHGNTNHGQQNRASGHRQDPLAYYFRTGPIGQLFGSFASGTRKNRIAVLGLGAGALACYAEENQDWTFFEIDPAVESIARNYFTFLEDAQDRGVRVQVITGDGRLSLARVPNQSYDLIFADAFSSDAVPIHLLTRQALDLYLSKLVDDGLIVFNITNRYVDLQPVLGSLAAHAGLVCLSCEEEESSIKHVEKTRGKTGSHWVVMARHEKDLGILMKNPAWKEISSTKPEWTDDYSNLLGAFRW